MSRDDPDREELRRRARLLARRKEAPRAAGEDLLAVEIVLASERYAVECAYVREVQTLRDLTPLPGTPPWIAGVVNVRGEILSVTDLRRLFALREKGLPEQTKLVVLEGEGRAFGVVADTVVGTRSVPLSSIAPPPPTIDGPGRSFLRGVAADGLIVLDALRILTDPSLVVGKRPGPALESKGDLP